MDLQKDKLGVSWQNDIFKIAGKGTGGNYIILDNEEHCTTNLILSFILKYNLYKYVNLYKNINSLMSY